MKVMAYYENYLFSSKINSVIFDISLEKRSQIEVLRKEGYSVRRIASLIGVHHSYCSKGFKSR